MRQAKNGSGLDRVARGKGTEGLECRNILEVVATSFLAI